MRAGQGGVRFTCGGRGVWYLSPAAARRLLALSLRVREIGAADEQREMLLWVVVERAQLRSDGPLIGDSDVLAAIAEVEAGLRSGGEG